MCLTLRRAAEQAAQHPAKNEGMMKPMRAVAAVTALLLSAQVFAATEAAKLQVLDTRIADAKQAAIAARKAADYICSDAGYEVGQRSQGLPNRAHKEFNQCMGAAQASNDAIGLVGYLYEQRSHLTGRPMPSEYACNGNAQLGAPHPDAKGHYTVCPKDPSDHSYTFWMITQVYMHAGSASHTGSDGGFISIRRYKSEAACRAGIAKYEYLPSKIPYVLNDGEVIGDVCVEVIIPNTRKLAQ
jgi:hypothetical protein